MLYSRTQIFNIPFEGIEWSLYKQRKNYSNENQCDVYKRFRFAITSCLNHNILFALPRGPHCTSTCTSKLHYLFYIWRRKKNRGNDKLLSKWVLIRSFFFCFESGVGTAVKATPRSGPVIVGGRRYSSIFIPCCTFFFLWCTACVVHNNIWYAQFETDRFIKIRRSPWNNQHYYHAVYNTSSIICSTYDTHWSQYTTKPLRQVRSR